MRAIFRILFGSALLLGFSQCGSCKETSHQVQTNVPFSIEKATYNDWVAGVKGGGSGTNVIVTIKIWIPIILKLTVCILEVEK